MWDASKTINFVVTLTKLCDLLRFYKNIDIALEICVKLSYVGPICDFKHGDSSRESDISVVNILLE